MAQPLSSSDISKLFQVLSLHDRREPGELLQHLQNIFDKRNTPEQSAAQYICFLETCEDYEAVQVEAKKFLDAYSACENARFDSVTALRCGREIKDDLLKDIAALWQEHALQLEAAAKENNEPRIRELRIRVKPLRHITEVFIKHVQGVHSEEKSESKKEVLAKLISLYSQYVYDPATLGKQLASFATKQFGTTQMANAEAIKNITLEILASCPYTFSFPIQAAFARHNEQAYRDFHNDLFVKKWENIADKLEAAAGTPDLPESVISQLSQEIEDLKNETRRIPTHLAQALVTKYEHFPRELLTEVIAKRKEYIEKGQKDQAEAFMQMISSLVTAHTPQFQALFEAANMLAESEHRHADPDAEIWERFAERLESVAQNPNLTVNEVRAIQAEIRIFGELLMAVLATRQTVQRYLQVEFGQVELDQVELDQVELDQVELDQDATEDSEVSVGFDPEELQTYVLPKLSIAIECIAAYWRRLEGGNRGQEAQELIACCNGLLFIPVHNDDGIPFAEFTETPRGLLIQTHVWTAPILVRRRELLSAAGA